MGKDCGSRVRAGNERGLMPKVAKPETKTKARGPWRESIWASLPNRCRTSSKEQARLALVDGLGKIEELASYGSKCPNVEEYESLFLQIASIVLELGEMLPLAFPEDKVKQPARAAEELAGDGRAKEDSADFGGMAADSVDGASRGDRQGPGGHSGGPSRPQKRRKAAGRKSFE
ncbi:uncharacterized protein LOC127793939 [Diospyros lotus]|uniref:uncharacterized protein LOC127793939 n=1 Tax=Diospyros lotus TaxID=55363 RepID=UPI0022537381|nr:uncharacterized protein LOC127793939 [Diospyros lotus]